jgi:methyl halide transferase
VRNAQGLDYSASAIPCNLKEAAEKRMGREEHFKEMYTAGETPWDIGKPDFNLIQTVTTTPIEPCKALEIGCGTGDNAIWLAQQNFHVTAIDASDVAIGKAREKTAAASVVCTFLVADFLQDQIKGAPFGFAFDRGCFHAFDSENERRSFAEKVSRCLEMRGFWLSLIGNADEVRQGPGPPQRSARDIANAAEPYFEVLSLVSSHFETNLPRRQEPGFA